MGSNLSYRERQRPETRPPSVKRRRPVSVRTTASNASISTASHSIRVPCACDLSFDCLFRQRSRLPSRACLWRCANRMLMSGGSGRPDTSCPAPSSRSSDATRRVSRRAVLGRAPSPRASSLLTGTSSVSPRATSISASGTESPRSHLETVCLTTFGLSASSSCDSPFDFLRAWMFSFSMVDPFSRPVPTLPQCCPQMVRCASNRSYRRRGLFEFWGMQAHIIP